MSEKADVAAQEREVRVEMVGEILDRISKHKGVVGYFVIEPQSGKILSFSGFGNSSRKVSQYVEKLKGFIDLAASTIRTIDWRDRMTFLRISCEKQDILVAPDLHNEYTMVVVQQFTEVEEVADV